jgi:hypothetical protein
MIGWVRGAQAAITCACLDPLERRLLTASHDGSIEMWNYNSGQLLHSFPPCASEVGDGGKGTRGW